MKYILPFAIFAVCLSIFSTSIPSIASAQQTAAQLQEITIQLSNENPSPGDLITVSAESFSADLNSANITWTVNGVRQQQGIGAISIQIEAPSLGKIATVKVSAVTSDGRQLSETINIGSGLLDIVIESDGYVPPFFRGKTPLAYQNKYRIIAFPHLADSSGKEYDPKTLVYTWEKDSKVIQDQSGYGKQVFFLKEDVVPRQRIIKVKATTRDGRIQTEKTVLLQAVAPSINFYIDDPLYGPLYNKSISNRISLGSSGELSILAVPFGFTKPADGVGDVIYSWMVNSGILPSLNESQSITLRSPGTRGSSEIGLQIKNKEDILQSAQGGFTVTFTDKESSASATETNTNFNGI